MIERRAKEVRLVRIVRRNGHARVVRLTAGEIAVEADDFPIHTAVLGAPQLAVVGRAAMQRITVSCFDQRVNAIRIRARDGKTDLSQLVGRKAIALKLRPRRTAVVRDVDAASRSTTLTTPGVHLELPRRGEQRLVVGGMHDDVDRAGVAVHEEDTLPRAPAISGAIEATFL